ncbi:hypothetical protein ACFJGV_01605 [Cnuibacter sp. UC19_7]|uniref:hypothetical protein n=1 Tax=Cnuibacter sp. UC19_7 TaxID=3350166 RepID=UPI00366B0987
MAVYPTYDAGVLSSKVPLPVGSGSAAPVASSRNGTITVDRPSTGSAHCASSSKLGGGVERHLEALRRCTRRPEVHAVDLGARGAEGRVHHACHAGEAVAGTVLGRLPRTGGRDVLGAGPEVADAALILCCGDVEHALGPDGGDLLRHDTLLEPRLGELHHIVDDHVGAVIDECLDVVGELGLRGAVGGEHQSRAGSDAVHHLGHRATLIREHGRVLLEDRTDRCRVAAGVAGAGESARQDVLGGIRRHLRAAEVVGVGDHADRETRPVETVLRLHRVDAERRRRVDGDGSAAGAREVGVARGRQRRAELGGQGSARRVLGEQTRFERDDSGQGCHVVEEVGCGVDRDGGGADAYRTHLDERLDGGDRRLLRLERLEPQLHDHPTAAVDRERARTLGGQTGSTRRLGRARRHSRRRETREPG